MPLASRAGVAAVVLAAALLPATSGCRSATAPPAVALPAAELAAAREALSGGETGDITALYRLKVPRAGGLRAALRTSGAAGRLTVSDPFGSAVSLVAWSDGDRGDVFDLEEGCRVPDVDLAAVLGVGRLPLEPMLRLLVGRLPAAEGDAVSVADGGLVVRGLAWQARVEVAPDPWRVTRVVGQVGDRHDAWRIALASHHGAVPGEIRIDRDDGRWARLELVRLVLGPVAGLPDLPDLPECGASGDQR